MRADKQALQAQEAAETARREAGKLGMQVLERQVWAVVGSIWEQPD
jgi:hypothetical protein